MTCLDGCLVIAARLRPAPPWAEGGWVSPEPGLELQWGLFASQLVKFKCTPQEKDLCTQEPVGIGTHVCACVLHTQMEACLFRRQAWREGVCHSVSADRAWAGVEGSPSARHSATHLSRLTLCSPVTS